MDISTRMALESLKKKENFSSNYIAKPRTKSKMARVYFEEQEKKNNTILCRKRLTGGLDKFVPVNIVPSYDVQYCTSSVRKAPTIRLSDDECI